MAGDVLDWANASAADQEAISGILRAFTLVEGHVSCYWGEVVTKLFPKHEIQALARLFSFQETVHARAYNHLSETLGIDEHAAFQGDPVAQRKVEAILRGLDAERDCMSMSQWVSLGVFSGAVEGVSLFASFVALLSLCQGGRFRGLSQILSWSTLDEDNHSKAGCRLYQHLREEGLIDADYDDLVVEGFEEVLANEDAFIRNIKFPPGHPLTAYQLMEYTRHRTNVCFKRLGIREKYLVDYNEIKPILDLYEPQLLGQVSNDFFSHSKEGSGYVATPTMDVNQIDWAQV